MKFFKFKSIKTRLIFWFITVALMPMFVITIFSIKHLVPLQKELIFNKLEAIRSLKVHKINNWIDQREGDIKTIADDPQIRGLVTFIGWKDQDPQQKALDIASVREFLKRYMKNFTCFYEILIISTDTRKIIVSTNEKVEGEDRSKDLYFTGALQSQGLFIKDIYYSKSEKKPSMAFSIPIYYSFGYDSIGGILVARINLEESLYGVLQNRVGMGMTGETLIVNRNFMALNTLRWDDTSPLKLKVETAPTIKAKKGGTGILETVDYRGEPVLAAYTYVPKTGWGFIAKQDLKEVYAPLKTLERVAATTGILILLFVIIIAFMIAISISKPIIRLGKGVKVVGSGNLNYKVGSNSQDEIGRLSRSFDQMTESLNKTTASRDQLDKEVAERRKIGESLVFERDKLKETLLEVKTLSGLLPICANCKKIRDDKGYWNQIESYIKKHTEANFSHGVCPDCAKELYPNLNLDK